MSPTHVTSTVHMLGRINEPTMPCKYIPFKTTGVRSTARYVLAWHDYGLKPIAVYQKSTPLEAIGERKLHSKLSHPDVASSHPHETSPRRHLLIPRNLPQPGSTLCSLIYHDSPTPRESCGNQVCLSSIFWQPNFHPPYLI